jgi:DNA-binding NtrC family response regulator
MEPLRVLVVDDDARLCGTLVDALHSWGHRAVSRQSGVEALNLLRRQLFDVVLLDIRLPQVNGLRLLRETKSHDAAIEVVMMTGYPEVASAVEALKQGAYDYLSKPIDLAELKHLLSRLLERRLLRQEVTSLRRRLGEQLVAQELVGASHQISQVRDLVARVAPTDSSVFIEGESGTGKELAAAAIHRLSGRSQGPFIPVNCGALPDELLESELFGHVRGAFSGAVADSLGLFRAAHGGTIFLDEVVELPPALQTALLRVLQDKKVRPVGSSKSYPVNVRVIAATNRRVEEAIKGGSLREDLFYRLNVVRLRVPPLREHKGDIPMLVAHFLRRLNQRFGREVKGLTPEAMAALMSYDFPGNVRELENLLERAYAFGVRDEIGLLDLPDLVSTPLDFPHGRGLPTLEQAERALIQSALQFYGGNYDEAARALGISRRTFYRRLKKHRIT